jgi:hypothetical protein
LNKSERDGYNEEVVSLRKRLADALPSAGGGEPVEQAVWEVYAGTEKLIAVLKFRLDYETPGVFTKLPGASDPVKLVKDASELLSRAAEQIGEGRLVDSIETLRKARNNLRSYLTEKKKSATRAQRKERSNSAV